ncbi:MAG: hypothetical protein KDA80_04670, partial [Planctomycetaceae bacterium]|nr:hypothetical protein [Planctomycetaceae bacterium]
MTNGPRAPGFMHGQIRRSTLPDLIVLGILFVLVSGCGNPTIPANELLSQARVALAKRSYSKVQQLVARIPESAPEWGDGQLLSAEAAFQAGDVDDALTVYLGLAESQAEPEDVAAGYFYAAEILR